MSRNPVSVLVVACCLWGLAGAASVGLDMGPFAYLVLVGGAQALVLGVVGRRRGWPLNPFGGVRLFFFSGSLLLVLASYYQALRWGPVGPVAAIHLSTPVLLVLWEAKQRRRRLDWRSLLAMALLAGGAAIAGLTRTGDGGDHPQLAVLLAIFSAVMMAVHTWQLSNWGGEINIRAAVMPKALLQVALFAPFAVSQPPPSLGYALTVFLLLGVAVTVPATLLHWSALSALPASVGASVALSEALFAGAWAAVAFGRPLTGLEVVATLLIVGGVLIEMRHPVHKLEAGGARPRAAPQVSTSA